MNNCQNTYSYSMKFNLLQITSIIATFHALIISSYLLINVKKATYRSYFLAFLLFSITILIICSLILTSGINRNLFLYAHIGNQIIFITGPLFYFYIRSWIDKFFKLKKSVAVHVIPYLLAMLYLIVKFYYYPFPLSCRSNHIILGSLAFISMFVYFAASLHLLREHGHSLRKTFDFSTNKKAVLLPFFIGSCFFIWLTKLLFFLVWDISGLYRVCNEVNNLFFLTVFLFITTLLYLLLIKPQFFFEQNKYKYSLLSETEKLDYARKLISYMENSSVYRNSLLTLTDLAKKITIPERYLSQVINESLNMSFYDLINWYRIKDCIHCLSDPAYSKMTILSVAYEVGFNSKSTFNTAFKKFTGVTPKEFRRNHKDIKSPVFQLNLSA
jgi:AraC-like DNA-binding protein